MISRWICAEVLGAALVLPGATLASNGGGNGNGGQTTPGSSASERGTEQRSDPLDGHLFGRASPVACDLACEMVPSDSVAAVVLGRDVALPPPPPPGTTYREGRGLSSGTLRARLTRFRRTSMYRDIWQHYSWCRTQLRCRSTPLSVNRMRVAMANVGLTGSDRGMWHSGGVAGPGVIKPGRAELFKLATAAQH